mgnify:CR=1 FL=1
MIEFIFGLLGIAVVIYIFKQLVDGVDENEMFLVGICLVWGPLIFILALIPTVMGLIDIIQYFIH